MLIFVVKFGIFAFRMSLKYGLFFKIEIILAKMCSNTQVLIDNWNAWKELNRQNIFLNRE